MFKWFEYKKKKKEKLSLPLLFNTFQTILKLNNSILEEMADMNDKSGGGYVFDRQYIISSCNKMNRLVNSIIVNFNKLVHNKYNRINNSFIQITKEIEAELNGKLFIRDTPLILFYKDLNIYDSDVAGGKAANFAELKNQLKLPVPVGFVISLSAFRIFMNQNNLNKEIEQLLEKIKTEQLNINEASQQIQHLILNSATPGSIKKAIYKAVKKINKIYSKKDISWAVRSSALGEDSENSFAGQFESILNVKSRDICSAYKQVIASTYSYQAILYRMKKGIIEKEVAMAVACQEIINPQKSGVVLTIDPSEEKSEMLFISSVWGLGLPIVSGEINCDEYKVSRKANYLVKSSITAQKKKKLVPDETTGCKFVEVDNQLINKPCLETDEIYQISSVSMAIEKYFKSPQEIEWAIDKDGKLNILQTRPMNLRNRISEKIINISELIKDRKIIFENKGIVAQNGVASGKVFIVNNDEDLVNFPAGAILVARQSSPKLAGVVGRAHGIITDIGSPTGHMATIAREFRVPAILGTHVATSLLYNNQEVTMDTEGKVVYEGIVEDLCLYQFADTPFEDSYEYLLLKRVLKKIAPLRMINPNHKRFKPEFCRTYHDITRFIHEKSVQSFIDIHEMPGWKRNELPSKRLDSSNLVDLSVIDIGTGLESNGNLEIIKFENIKSIPMKAFLEGIKTKGLWDKNPAPVDFKGFMSSLTRTVPANLSSPGAIGQNLAIISKHYCNINLRLGYHFSLMDSYISDQVNDNYAYFRFFGGVTEQQRRGRRALLIARILEKNDFRVTVKGDFVVGRVKKFDSKAMYEKVKIIGQLVSFTRQLDIKMNSDKLIETYLNKFTEISKASG